MNRVGFFGASDFGPLLGLSKWKTPHQLFLEKMGELEPTPETLYQAVGNALEPVVLQKWATRAGATLLGKPRYAHPQLPWLQVALDGEAETGDGEILVVEAKTCSFSKRDGGWGPVGSEQIPAAYWAQVQAQMLCARLNGRPVNRAIVTCLFLNRLGESETQPQAFNVPFDATAAERMVSRATEFWKHVEARKWPGEIQ